MKSYTFVLTETETNLVMQALGELPAKFSFELIGNLRSQAEAANAPPVDLPVKAEKK